jgi:hypothetical protein
MPKQGFSPLDPSVTEPNRDLIIQLEQIPYQSGLGSISNGVSKKYGDLPISTALSEAESTYNSTAGQPGTERRNTEDGTELTGGAESGSPVLAVTHPEVRNPATCRPRSRTELFRRG